MGIIRKLFFWDEDADFIPWEFSKKNTKIHQREMKSSLSSASQNIELSQNIEPSLRQEVSIKRKHQQAKIFNQARILNKGSKQEVLI